MIVERLAHYRTPVLTVDEMYLVEAAWAVCTCTGHPISVRLSPRPINVIIAAGRGCSRY